MTGDGKALSVTCYSLSGINLISTEGDTKNVWGVILEWWSLRYILAINRTYVNVNMLPKDIYAETGCPFSTVVLFPHRKTVKND